MKATAFRGMALLTLTAVLAMTLGGAPQEERPAQDRAAPAVGAETFQIDSGHSSNVFKIRHMGIANFYGRFNSVSGTVAWDAADPAKSSINVDIKTESIDTNSKGRDDHLKSADFFDVEKHPTLGFKSTSIKKTGPNTCDVTGDLSLHGVTKSITVKFEHAGPLNTARGRGMGLETTFTIKRSDYGMTKALDNGGLGDEVTMTVSLECAVPRKREGG